MGVSHAEVEDLVLNKRKERDDMCKHFQGESVDLVMPCCEQSVDAQEIVAPAICKHVSNFQTCEELRPSKNYYGSNQSRSNMKHVHKQRWSYSSVSSMMISVTEIWKGHKRHHLGKSKVGPLPLRKMFL